jgi:ferredoxin
MMRRCSKRSLFSLFFALVVALPILSRRRTQCGLFCPMGAFRICPTFSIDAASLDRGVPRLSCCKCGRCVDECPKGAATSGSVVH